MRNLFHIDSRNDGVDQSASPLFATLTATILFVLMTLPSADAATSAFRINTLSNRSDMLSGGDALIRIDVSQAIELRHVRVTLNGSDVTSVFRRDEASHALMGLVTGMADGDNTLTVVAVSRASKNFATQVKLVNHLATGPVFAGPKEIPFICGTEDFKLRSGGTLGPALDANCSVKTRIDYVYRSKDGGDLRPLPDPKNAPLDVAETTTLLGVTVPYIVRIETGTINRAIYQISMLHNPASEPALNFATKPAGWNGRLIYTFGGGCVNGWYRQGSTTGGVEDDVMLRQGYAVASSTLNVYGNNCDDVLSAETVMMVKEHFIEAYGVPKFTIGWGCSGGAEQIQPIAQNYPGLLDGIIPGCSFADAAFALVPSITDARLLNHYFTLALMSYSDQQKLALSGYVSMATMILVDKVYAGRIKTDEFCPAELPISLRFNRKTNPKGVPCDVYDHAVNVYGRDPKTGFARRPLDNVGIQYGLQALNAGTISKEQFLDLNEKIGGFDENGDLVPQRSVADIEAVRRAYRTGRITMGGGGLASTPIIDYRAYADDDPAGNGHLRYFSFSTRARLLKTNGYFDNQIMLVEDRRAGLYSTKSPVLREALAQMDRWLSDLSEDASKDPQIVKVRRTKPADLVDACWSRDTEPQKIVEVQTYGSGRCEQLYPSASFPRGVAGSPIAGDVIKCQLKPIDPRDYKVQFTDDETSRLKKMFPGGVCDWSKPGAEQQGLAGTWLTYGSN